MDSKHEHKDLFIKERLKKKYVFEASLRPEFPKKNMMVELINGCNHRCIFCAQGKMTRKKSEIDPELLKKIMTEAYSLGVREIGFYATSEPFLCNKLAEHVAEAKKIGFKYVYITTNGALATPDKIRAVIDSGLDSIKFSINAGNREMYKFIHGYDDFDKVIEHLKYCHGYRAITKADYKIYISYIVTRYNADDTEKFKLLYSQYCDDIAFYTVKNFGGLMPEIRTHIAPLDCPQPKKSVCPHLFKFISISSEGYLVACACTDFQNYLVVGDLNKTSLYDAWYSEKFTELRKRYIEDDLKGLQCYNCVYEKTEAFEPLSPEYATRITMDELYTDKILKERLAKRNDGN